MNNKVIVEAIKGAIKRSTRYNGLPPHGDQVVNGKLLVAQLETLISILEGESSDGSE